MSSDVKKYLNAKNLIRLLGILLIVLFFVPSFLVSCTYSSYDTTSYKLSAFKVMTGVKIEGEQYLEPSIVAVIFLLLPIAILVITFLKKYLSNLVMNIVITACSGVDFLAWLVLSARVKAGAADLYCVSKPMAGFVFNVLFTLIILAGGILALTKVIDLDKCFLEPGYFFPGKNGGGAAEGGQSAVAAVCANCGAKIPAGNKFCNACGTPVAETAPAQTVCANCGAEIPAGNKFCNACGTPVATAPVTETPAPEANPVQAEAPAAEAAPVEEATPAQENEASENTEA